ncbi:hypothetical protein EV177_004510 [Coemansia sp. RSA 1804]|nr:hypothetical protein EV177_004510 [Coemansia sp. RSA 1804]
MKVSSTCVPKKRRARSQLSLHVSDDVHEYSSTSDEEDYQYDAISVINSYNESEASHDAENTSSADDQFQKMDDVEPGRYPRYMLPRTSGMSTMGEIHSLGPSPHNRSPASSAMNISGYNQGPVYPATWHEYEDQFNYFYNCHFIEQDYYNYLANHYRRSSDSNEDEDGGIGDTEDIDKTESYSDNNLDEKSKDESDSANVDSATLKECDDSSMLLGSCFSDTQNEKADNSSL